MEKTLLNTLVVEKIITKHVPTDATLKRQTKWIATQALVPIVTSVFGAYINPFCHVHEAYSEQFLQSLNL